MAEKFFVPTFNDFKNEVIADEIIPLWKILKTEDRGDHVWILGKSKIFGHTEILVLQFVKVQEFNAFTYWIKSEDCFPLHLDCPIDWFEEQPIVRTEQADLWRQWVREQKIWLFFDLN